MLFTLEQSHWYAAEIIGDEFGEDLRSYSPIFVYEAKPLKTGQGQLELSFHHENYPEGVQQKRYRLQILVREERFLIARRVDAEGSTRVVMISALTWPWLTKNFDMRPINDATDPQTALGHR